MTLPTRPGLIGARASRLEDDSLLAGRGSYVADVRLPRMVEAAFLRSPEAHARIVGVDTSAASATPGVLAAIAARDLAGLSAVPDFHPRARPVRTFPLCTDRVRYVGAPIAAVVAADRYDAEDALEQVTVDLDPLPAIASIDAALAPGAPTLHDEWPDNIIVQAHVENPSVAECFYRLRSIEGTYAVQRHGAVPMETRGTVAEFRHGRLTVWTATQFPHITRTMISYVLRMPEHRIRVIAPDVGGGFGCKAQVYPEDYVVCALAIQLRRPVRWIEDRVEHLQSTCQARDVRIELEAAVNDDGSVEALRGRILQDVGSAESFPNGFNPSFVALGSLTGPYRIPHQEVEVLCVVTNKTPSGAYRGFGQPEATFAMERLVDRIGHELALDPVSVRRAMILDPSELPYRTASGALLDSGSHREALERAVQLGTETLEELRRDHLDDPAARIGLGIATFVEGTAPTYFGTTGQWTSQDSCDIRFHPDGAATVSVGVSTAGQGLQTMVATVTADALGLPIEHLQVVMGDTDLAPHGLGGWGSRSTVVACGAIELAATELREKGRQIAAHLLEVAPEDLELADGRFSVRGSSDLGVTWGQVATAALVRTFELPPHIGPGLDARATFVPPNIDSTADELGRINIAATYSNATHAAVVKVDEETGGVEVLRYVVVHDCGRVVNPQVVAGQIHGGVAQGIGGALLEEFEYDDAAQPLSTSFMTYLVPTAAEIPPLTVEELESPAPEVPFGVKGVGEAGVIGPAPAIARAVEHALEDDLRIDHITATPVAPAVLLDAIDRARIQSVG